MSGTNEKEHFILRQIQAELGAAHSGFVLCAIFLMQLIFGKSYIFGIYAFIMIRQ